MNENKRTNTKKNITISRIKRTQRPTIILSYLLVTEQDQTQKNKLLENINRLPAEKALEINEITKEAKRNPAIKQQIVNAYNRKK
ncbi:MAG: hypothetical protein V8Q90_06975 [Bacilli bacterium]